MNYDLYTGILKMNDDFEPGNNDKALSYDFSSPQLQTLKTQYGLADIAGNRPVFSQVKNVMAWMAKHIYHDGCAPLPQPTNALTYLGHAFDKGSQQGINCLALSEILTGCLLSLGITARVVSCMPYSPYDIDNHVITHAYLPEMQKWAFFDPTLNAYVLDENGNPLDVFEVRDRLKDQKPFVFNDDFHYNGEAYSQEEYIAYLAKDLFYFTTAAASCFETGRNSVVVSVCPKGFDIQKARIANIEYQMRKDKGNKGLQYRLEQEKTIRPVYISPKELLAAPK